MKRLGMWARAFAVVGMVFLSGCGGDDDDPSFHSPSSLRGRTYTMTGDQGPGSITFAESGNVYSVTRFDVQLAPVGTYTATRSGNLWRVMVTTPDATFTSELLLTFTGPGRGAYRFTEPGWQFSEEGPFEEVGFTGNPTLPGTTTTGTTTTGGTTGTPVNAPASLSRIIMTGIAANPAGAGPFTFDFSGTGSGSFTSGSTFGTFAYTPSTTSPTTAILRLTFSGSGDVDDYTLSFLSGNRGAFMGTQQAGVNQGPASGTFEYTP